MVVESGHRTHASTLEERQFTREEADRNVHHFYHRVVSPLVAEGASKLFPGRPAVYEAKIGSVRSIFMNSGLDSDILKFVLGNQDADGAETLTIVPTADKTTFYNYARNSALRVNLAYGDYKFGVQAFLADSRKGFEDQGLLHEVKTKAGHHDDNFDKIGDNPSDPDHVRYDMFMADKLVKTIKEMYDGGLLTLIDRDKMFRQNYPNWPKDSYSYDMTTGRLTPLKPNLT